MMRVLILVYVPLFVVNSLCLSVPSVTSDWGWRSRSFWFVFTTIITRDVVSRVGPGNHVPNINYFLTTKHRHLGGRQELFLLQELIRNLVYHRKSDIRII